MGIISLLLVVVIPVVSSLSKASGQKAAVSNVMNLLEQARTLAVSSGNATYVVFADQTTPEKYRCKAYIVFKEDPQTFSPVAITKWHFLPNGISFQPNSGLLKTPAATPAVKFTCPGEIGTTPVALPFLKFDASGMVASPTDPNILFANVFAGSVDGGGTLTYTDQAQKSSQKFDQVAIARFTGHARYVDPYL